jgi:hypothetical protein
MHMSTRQNKAGRTNDWPPASVLNPGPHHKWSREVVFDFHEVCVMWTEQFCRFLNAQEGLNIDPKAIRYYHMQMDPANRLTPEKFDEAFKTFARLSKGGYGDLRAHEGIKETIEAIQKAGIKVSIWTWTPGAAETTFDGASSYNTGIAQRVTRDLIRRLGLPVDVERDVQFMRPERKKWQMVEEHIPLIVEDNPETAMSVGLGMAHAAILVPETYNQGLVIPNVLRLSDRSELAPAVISFYKKLDEAGVLL